MLWKQEAERATDPERGGQDLQMALGGTGDGGSGHILFFPTTPSLLFKKETPAALVFLPPLKRVLDFQMFERCKSNKETMKSKHNNDKRLFIWEVLGGKLIYFLFLYWG